ncbi:MAG: DUF2189 domain-containing protein [Janthinobacterium lividum]
MALSFSPTLARPRSAPAAVRAIGFDDLRSALRAGIDDFLAMPTHVVVLVLIYPVIGVFIARLSSSGDLLPLAYPMAAGFALLGPFAALGVYALSRRRERGELPSWSDAFDALRTPGIAALGLVQLAIFAAWIATAQVLFGLLADGFHPGSIGDLLGFVFGTTAGWALIVLGNGLGFLFAALAFAISVISLPLLLDRGGTAGDAVRTSLDAVRASPGPMAAWGFIVAAALLLGSLPVFVGLAVVLPVLGHATWHLYRRVVPESGA